MSNSIIPVPAPVGTNLQSFQNTIGPNVVQAEAVTLVDSSGNEKATSGNPVSVSLPAGQAVELLDGGGSNKAAISAAGAISVDGSGVTQPISGTISVNNFPATQPVSAAALPFPNGCGSLLSGQGTAISSATGLPSNSCKKVTLKNSISSTATIYVGPSGVTATTGLELIPGDSVDIPVSNTNLVFVITASGSGTYSWLAVN